VLIKTQIKNQLANSTKASLKIKERNKKKIEGYHSMKKDLNKTQPKITKDREEKFKEFLNKINETNPKKQ